jgi:hypothetical protein
VSLPPVSGVSAVSSDEPAPDGAAVLSDVELLALSEDRWLVHQLKVADTEPPVSAIRALNAVELSDGTDGEFAEEWWARNAVHSPNRALLFAGPVVGIDTGVVAALLVVLARVVDVVDVVDDVDVVSADDPAFEALDRPKAELVLPVVEAWVGRTPDAAAAAVPAPRTATVAIAAALAERIFVSTFLLGELSGSPLRAC